MRKSRVIVIELDKYFSNTTIDKLIAKQEEDGYELKKTQTVSGFRTSEYGHQEGKLILTFREL